jgi:hypothetical protein
LLMDHIATLAQPTSQTSNAPSCSSVMGRFLLM